MAGVIDVVKGILLIAAGYLISVVTGKNRAEVRSINSQAAKNEADTGTTWQAIADRSTKMFEEMQEKLEKREAEMQAKIDGLEAHDEVREKEMKALRARVEKLEAENKLKDEKILKLEIENARLRKNGGAGLADR